MMEIKFTKHGIKTEELITSDTFEFQMEENTQIHSKSDVKRIIKCSSKSVLTSKHISDKTITFEGTVTPSITGAVKLPDESTKYAEILGGVAEVKSRV